MSTIHHRKRLAAQVSSSLSVNSHNCMSMVWQTNSVVQAGGTHSKINLDTCNKRNAWPTAGAVLALMSFPPCKPRLPKGLTWQKGCGPRICFFHFDQSLDLTNVPLVHRFTEAWILRCKSANGLDHSTAAFDENTASWSLEDAPSPKNFTKWVRFGKMACCNISRSQWCELWPTGHGG